MTIALLITFLIDIGISNISLKGRKKKKKNKKKEKSSKLPIFPFSLIQKRKI